MSNDRPPIAIDLHCGKGGWTLGLQAAGFRSIGFDIVRHDYPGELVRPTAHSAKKPARASP